MRFRDLLTCTSTQNLLIRHPSIPWWYHLQGWGLLQSLTCTLLPVCSGASPSDGPVQVLHQGGTGEGSPERDPGLTASSVPQKLPSLPMTNGWQSRHTHNRTLLPFLASLWDPIWFQPTLPHYYRLYLIILSVFWFPPNPLRSHKIEPQSIALLFMFWQVLRWQDLHCSWALYPTLSS